MAPGKYPHWITIVSPTATENPMGDRIVSDTAVATAFASIEPLSGRELQAAAQTWGETTHRMRMPMPAATVKTSHEVLFGSRRFRIIWPHSPGERGRELVLLCKETTQ